MTRTAAVVSTSSILGIIFVYFLNGPVALVYLLFGVAVGAITILLVRLYRILSRLEGVRPGGRHFRMRGHILLHLVPFSFLVLQFFAKTSLIVNTFYLAPVMLFFLTGRLTWRALYEEFGSKMYKLFYSGNTGMLVGLPVMLGLGILFEDAFVSDAFRRVLLVYFVIHLLLTGVAVMKIEKDVLAGGSESVPR